MPYRFAAYSQKELPASGPRRRPESNRGRYCIAKLCKFIRKSYPGSTISLLDAEIARSPSSGHSQHEPSGIYTS
jgi:hypothetical protein